MKMEKFMKEHVQSVRVLENNGNADNPLRIHNDGHRSANDYRFSLAFRHRSDRDLIIFYSANYDPYAHRPVPNGRVLDALAYVRRRMAYTQTAIRYTAEFDGQVMAWRQTGVAPRLTRLNNEHVKNCFQYHRAVYLEMADFMGEAILNLFLAATPEGDENE